MFMIFSVNPCNPQTNQKKPGYFVSGGEVGFDSRFMRIRL